MFDKKKNATKNATSVTDDEFDDSGDTSLPHDITIALKIFSSLLQFMSTTSPQHKTTFLTELAPILRGLPR